MGITFKISFYRFNKQIYESMGAPAKDEAEVLTKRDQRKQRWADKFDIFEYDYGNWVTFIAFLPIHLFS